MDKWELQIQGFPSSPDPRILSKALQSATAVLKTDLADFETEKMFETLLQSPVDLLKTILAQYPEETWSNAITDGFKLIGSVAKKYQMVLEPYFENIVKICQLPHLPHVRRQALLCLGELSRVTPQAATSARRFATELETSSTCRTELALLVGTLCEYHPEVLENQAHRIWRTYLSFLSSSGLTDKFISAVLEGASGLLSSFGRNLPIIELFEFYDAMARLRGRCRNACITVLRHHSSLFKERIADDVQTRAILWSVATQDGVRDALIAVYGAVAEVKRDGIEAIIQQEVMPQLSLNKITALTVLSHLRGPGFDPDLESYVDVQHLEFELRCGSVSYYTADLIIWYIKSGLSDCCRLSQSSVLFYRNIPTNKIAELAAAILSNEDVREETITFLASECSQPAVDHTEYMSLWKAFLYSEADRAFEDYLRYLEQVLECWLEDEKDTLPEKLSSHLRLTTDILSLSHTSDSSPNLSLNLLCKLLGDSLRRCLAAELANVTAAILQRGGCLQDGVWDYISVYNCRDEATMCGCCLLLLHAPRTADQGNVLKALQIIFSRKDVEDITLLRAVQKLETLIGYEYKELDSFEVNKAISLVKKLQKRKHMTEKDGRILQRHITMFLGKYDGRIDQNNNEIKISVVTSKLKETLFLSLPNSEGERVKINLREILTLAIEEDDSEALTELLKVVCASLSTRRDPALLSALCTLCVALCRANEVAGDTVSRAILFCDTTDACHEILSLISSEQSPGVRKMLCSYLPAVLTDELMESALSRARSMMGGHGTAKMASLDLIEALLPAIEDNHSLIKTELPLILDSISKINQLDATPTLDQAKKLFTEKQALFSEEEVVDLYNRLLSNLIAGKVDRCSVKTYIRSTDLCLKMAADLTDVKIDVTTAETICNVKDRDCFKSLYVLAVLKENYEFDSSISVIINKYVLKELFGLEFCDSWMFELTAILVFMTEFAGTLLELDYEKTTQFLASIMRNVTPNQLIEQEKNLKMCLKTYKDILKYYPKILEDSFEFWLTNLTLPQLQDFCIDESHYTNMKALNIYLEATEFYLHSFMDKLKMWPKYVLRKYVEGASGSELSFLTDCLTAAVKVTGFDVKRILLEGKSSGDFVGVKFVAKFMKVFLDFLLKKPFLLLDDDLSCCCVVLDDVVKFCTRRQCSDDTCSLVLELEHELWPKYESQTNFHQKYQLLYNMSFLPRNLGRESNPMLWVASQLDKPNNRVNSTRLIAVLPGEDEFSDCYTKFAANNLGASLSQTPAATLRSLFDAKPTQALLTIQAALAETDEDIQDKWWDKAMDACCATLAQSDKFDACDILLAASAGSLSLGVCNRLILPLLRYSTATYCERFFSRHHTTLLNSLSKKPRDIRVVDKYRQLIVERTRALLILQVAFEKIPLPSLESPLSPLYKFNDPRPSTSNYLTWSTCKLCVTLRREECPFVEMSSCFRRYQCAIYSCLCAAICKSKPADKFYSLLFGPEAWGKIEDETTTYEVPVVKRRRKTRRCVSIPLPGTTGTGTAGTIGTAGTTATPMFLRTLSEHPHKFDLYPKEVEQVEIQELELTDNQINRHPLAATITALLTDVSSLPCWTAVCGRLSVDSWLLAQCICNSRVALAPHASTLRPALLEFSAKTLQKTPLNGLHVDILETLTHWSGDPSLPSQSLPHLQTTINALIIQAIEQRDPFIQILDEFLAVYGKFVSVEFEVFENYFKDRTSKCLSVIQKIVKHKIHIPNLVQEFLKMDFKKWLDEYKMAECFGAALSCESERDSAIQSFRDLLKRVKQSESYVKLLFYAQLGCSEICDEVNFRQTTDQTRKLPKTLQNKCLQILSTYLSQQSIDFKTSMFETIELSELLTTDNVEALGLVANGLKFMEENFKRRVVRQSLEYCNHSMEKVRNTAYKVAAKAFEEIFQPIHSNEGEPSSKRFKRTNASLLEVMNETDLYILNVVSKVAAGVMSHNDDVISVVRSVLKRSLGERLVECLTLLASSSIKDVSSCAAILQLFLSELRSDQRFMAAKLRDDPLETIEPKRSSNSLTGTKTCRGTLLSYRVSGARRRTKHIETPAAEIDVQVSLDSILEALLQFAKRHPPCGAALLHQTASQILGPGFDSRAAFGLLTSALATPCDLTPVYIKLARLVIGDDERFEESANRLKELSSGSDDEGLVQCLCEELMMRKGIEIFEIRSSLMPCQDVAMEDTEFSLRDLTSCFGRLSNWEDLTIQQKEVNKNNLPTLWTDEERFKCALIDFDDSSLTSNWFVKLRSSFTGDTKDSSRWLEEARKWPRRRFTESAVAEALSWQLDEEPWTCDISPKDCLVEWSARLMIRASQAKEREAIYSSRSNELLWCSRANEMGLYRAVLQCCDRNNIDNLTDDEKVSWNYQKILSVFGMGLERNDNNLLREALDTAEDLVTNITDMTSDSIGLYKQVFLLKQHLNELTTDNVNEILRKINSPLEKSFFKSKPILISLYEMALIHYDKLWTNDITIQDEVIKNLSFTLHQMRASNLGPDDRQVALLLNRLKGYLGQKIRDDEVKNMILGVFTPDPQYFDETTQQQINSTFPLLNRHKVESSSSFKLFSPVRDAGYCLLQYCGALTDGVDVEEKWNETFKRIKDMMDNPHVGTEYHLLTAQKNRLYAIADFDSTTKQKKLDVLRSVMTSLNTPPRTTLRISQLSPSLRAGVRELVQRGEVVRVDDQVTVITNSIRRPCVITLLTDLGTRVRYMHKSGEPLARDAGVLRAVRGGGYKVIPTSEDSGLIEYLEDHETLHSMISSVCNIDAISASVQRPNDDELIITPSPHTYKQLRDKVPVNALRTAIERDSSSVEDFLMKKKNFQDSLATTAIFNCLLGVGDRHLQNFLYSLRTGRLVSIDFGAAFSFVRELPVARLTACLLAVTDLQVLESRLQSELSEYRKSEYLFCNFLKMTFDWDKNFIEDKLPHIQASVSGRRLPHQVSRELIQNSRRKYKEAYLKLFDEVFADFEDKDRYSVVEQTRSLLVASTCPLVLRVTRAGWTSWV